MALDAGGGAKRRRVDEQEDQRDGVVAEAIPLDRISVLPNELLKDLLTHLSLKDAIHTGVLARSWRDLWKSRWMHDSSGSVEIHLSSRAAVQRELDKLETEARPRRRLDRFSLIVDICNLSTMELRHFLDYAAECHVEDVHVETRKRTVAEKLHFPLPRSSPLLARLSLLRINMSNLYFNSAQPLHALEVILLHSVTISRYAVRKMMALCPSLLTLDLRNCDCDDFFYWQHHNIKRLVYPQKLRSFTIVECNGFASLNLVGLPSLRSFCYSGSARSFSLPKDAALADLLICLDDSISTNWDIYLFNKYLPNDLSGLTVLTICSNVLMGVYSSYHYEPPSWAKSSSVDGPREQNPKLSNLQSLRELHLLMLKMGAKDLTDIYMFLKTCQCTNLERLFVQLPTSDCEASHDVMGEEQPEDGLVNLKIVKIMNFNWRRIELLLVSFLLRKATSLHKLLVVSPTVAPLEMPGVPEADQWLLKEAISNGKIVVSESDGAAIQPYHSEVFIEV